MEVSSDGNEGGGGEGGGGDGDGGGGDGGGGDGGGGGGDGGGGSDDGGDDGGGGDGGGGEGEGAEGGAEGGKAIATVGNDSTMTPSTAEADSAVTPNVDNSELCTAEAVVGAGTAMEAVMRTLAATTRMVTNHSSRPAASATFCRKLEVSE